MYHIWVPDKNDNVKVLNLLAKYHIYIQKLKGNDNIDMYAYLAYLKKLNMEKHMHEWKQTRTIRYICCYLWYSIIQAKEIGGK